MTRMFERSRVTLTAAGSRPSDEPLESHPVDAAPLGFEQFFREQHGDLFRALCLLCGNRHEAEEVMQDAFLRVWERWDRVAKMEDPAGYLFRTGMNVFRSRARRARVAVRKALKPLNAPDPLSNVEERDAIVRQLGKLTPRQRVAIVLVDALDLPGDQVAALMSIRPSTVRVLVARARASLRGMEVPDE